MNNKLMIWTAIVLGVLLLLVSIEYFITPAGSLPSFMPGFDAGVNAAHVHYKHAIASFILGLALFAFAWFQSAPKKVA
jgi:uncharacterized membrane-anchored protein YitT (DUF2179 family)